VGPSEEGQKDKPTRYTQYPNTPGSRDALKAIRPKSTWDWWLFALSEGPRAEAFAPNDDRTCHQSPILPTEELAELHAIIQAIEYERRSAATNP
jgi:hypothetical protein